MSTKVTKRHFEIFKIECKKWIDILGLKGYEFHFSNKDVGNGNIGQAEKNCTSRITRISLCKTWPKDSMVELNDDNIKLIAFEEICHVFLYSLSSCAYARHIMDHEIDEAEHSIIRTLQNTLYTKYQRG